MILIRWNKCVFKLHRDIQKTAVVTMVIKYYDHIKL